LNIRFFTAIETREDVENWPQYLSFHWDVGHSQISHRREHSKSCPIVLLLYSRLCLSSTSDQFIITILQTLPQWQLWSLLIISQDIHPWNSWQILWLLTVVNSLSKLPFDSWP
jgi:hypothetical protein